MPVYPGALRIARHAAVSATDSQADTNSRYLEAGEVKKLADQPNKWSDTDQPLVRFLGLDSDFDRMNIALNLGSFVAAMQRKIDGKELVMVLGISLHTFTLIHVVISFFGIASGLVVMYGFLTKKRLDGWTSVFLATTALTSVTGFLFPFNGVTPAIILGVISLVILAVAMATRYPRRLTWRKTYVITACAALYFNVFVLVVQSFEKVPSLKALAPTQKEPPFAIAQIAVFAIFAVLTAFAVKRFRLEPATAH
jgi:hypothetical protein